MVWSKWHPTKFVVLSCPVLSKLRVREVSCPSQLLHLLPASSAAKGTAAKGKMGEPQLVPFPCFKYTPFRHCFIARMLFPDKHGVNSRLSPCERLDQKSIANSASSATAG